MGFVEEFVGTLKMRDMKMRETLFWAAIHNRHSQEVQCSAVSSTQQLPIATVSVLTVAGCELTTATTARTATTTTLPCPTPTARPKVRSTPHQTRHRRQTPTIARCVCWRLETHESRWCRVATNVSVLLVPSRPCAWRRTRLSSMPCGYHSHPEFVLRNYITIKLN